MYKRQEEGADYKSYADIIKQIDDTKKQLAALELPATGTFSQAVKDIIDVYKRQEVSYVRQESDIGDT